MRFRCLLCTQCTSKKVLLINKEKAKKEQTQSKKKREWRIKVKKSGRTIKRKKMQGKAKKWNPLERKKRWIQIKEKGQSGTEKFSGKWVWLASEECERRSGGERGEERGKESSFYYSYSSGLTDIAVTHWVCQSPGRDESGWLKWPACSVAIKRTREKKKKTN